MVERIYDTLKGILFTDLPKNNKDQVVVYDRPILGWYFGDRDVKPSNLSIIFYGTSVPLKDVSLGLQEYEHRITIGVDAGAVQFAVVQLELELTASPVERVLRP